MYVMGVKQGELKENLAHRLYSSPDQLIPHCVRKVNSFHGPKLNLVRRRFFQTRKTVAGHDPSEIAAPWEILNGD